MEFIAIYRDPKKKKLQRLEILFVIVALPLALVWGSRSYEEWTRFQQADQLFREGDALLHQGKLDEAVGSLEKCVAIYPEFYSAWEMLGATYHMRLDHQKELDAYQRAVAVLPDNGLLQRELGTVYHELGDHKKELEHLTLAQKYLGKDEVFTLRLLDRAQREADGTYPTEVAKAPGGSNLEPAQGAAAPAPTGHDDHAGHDHGPDDHAGHGHDDHAGHDHSGHDHAGHDH